MGLLMVGLFFRILVLTVLRCPIASKKYSDRAIFDRAALYRDESPAILWVPSNRSDDSLYDSSDGLLDDESDDPLDDSSDDPDDSSGSMPDRDSYIR